MPVIVRNENTQRSEYNSVDGLNFSVMRLISIPITLVCFFTCLGVTYSDLATLVGEPNTPNL